MNLVTIPSHPCNRAAFFREYDAAHPEAEEASVEILPFNDGWYARVTYRLYSVNSKAYNTRSAARAWATRRINGTTNHAAGIADERCNFIGYYGHN